MGNIKSVLSLGTAAALISGCSIAPQHGTAYQQHRPANLYATTYNNSVNYQHQSRPIFSQQYTPERYAERNALLAQAHRALGTRYKYGGETPQEGFDCSGLTQYVYKQSNNIRIPRTAAQQSQASRTIYFEQMRPGDLIFFRTSGNKVNHVGIYIGQGKFIHAASGGKKVTIDKLSKSYWQRRLVKFGTFLS